ncbi:MAG: 1-acyl-sn-glycerol-3-phosphate acyltransferase [Limisphaerales bacterium]|jgi:1-acyl-sn-glycerol-3-phosphate acyltransferase
MAASIGRLLLGVPMHLLKGITAITFIMFNAALVWIPLTLWIIQRAWTRGEALVALRKRMDLIIWWWSANNRRMLRWLNIVEPDIRWKDEANMSKENWYLVISNHQSWTDIVLLQCFMYPTISPLKFFTKEQLIWVPFIGLAMKVLGFPYVKRVTKKQMRANPELRNADKTNTLAACDGFKNHPTSILNFVEGTRRTSEKQARQSGEFSHLLRPKVGGLGYVIEGMDDYLSNLLDVTIIYPDGVPTFWAFLQGRSPRVIIDIQPHTIPEQIYQSSDAGRRAALAQWIKQLWIAKDQRIADALSAD